MLTYLLKRLLLLIPTFLGITFVTFMMVKLAPGDPVSLKLAFRSDIKTDLLETAATTSEEAVTLPKPLEAALAKLPGALHPSSEWFFKNAVYYGRWLMRILRLDFGLSSKDHRPVLTRIAEALPVTLLLNVLNILIVYAVSVPLGIWSALNRHKRRDEVVTFGLFILYSLPTFWMATLLLMLFASGEYFDWLPLTGITSDYFNELSGPGKLLDLAWHLVLPVLCLTYGSLAFLSRFSRATFLDVIRQDYIRTAMAKGLAFRDVIWKHAFRNTLIPMLTLAGTLLPALIGGSVIIEQIFGIPGMGRLGFEAVLSRDRNLIMGIATISAFLTLVSLLITDFLYAWADPRISYGDAS